MSEIVVQKVSNRKQMHDFVHVVETIYHGNLYYVPDLYSDIRAMFNPRKNKAMAKRRIQIFPWLTSTDPHDCISKSKTSHPYILQTL